MSDTDTLSERLIREIIEGCEGVTPGPWESDGIKNDGFMSYEVTDPNNRSVADALNAGVIEVQEEEGRGWDEQGRKNMAHIARLDPATVRSMATELLANRTALDAANATIERLREALTEIASFTQTVRLLWWQERAREALEPARQAQEPTS